MLVALIVENSVISRKSLKQIVAARYPNVRAMEAANGREALQAVMDKVPDVVLMNIRLPDLKGLEVLREIRRQSHNTAVVVLADEDTPEYREAALRNGADQFIAMCSLSAEEITSLLDAAFLGATNAKDAPLHHSP